MPLPIRRAGFAAWCLLAVPGSVHAQLRYSGALGVGGASTLVHDEIFQPISLRQKLFPTLTLGASLPIDPRYRAGLELAVATGGSTVKSGGTSTDGPTIRTLTLSGAVEGRIWRGLYWRGGAGILKYLPAEDEGLFRRGGPTRALLALGADYRWKWRHRMELFAAARYDYHRFTTEELQVRGFTRSQDVHRLTVSLGIAGGGS